VWSPTVSLSSGLSTVSVPGRKDFLACDVFSDGLAVSVVPSFDSEAGVGVAGVTGPLP